MHSSSTRLAVLCALILFCTSACGMAQTPQTPEQKELIRVQIAKEKALTEYYLGQLEISRKQAKTPTSERYTTLMDKYTHKDPGDLVESVAAMLGAAILLVMLIATYRTSRRDRRDGEFYEALKRFGDAQSPALRSTAAGMLAQMARRPAYFDTAMDQLLSGLMLEEHPAVAASIVNAVAGLARSNPRALSARLRHVDVDMRDKVRTALGDLVSL